MLTYLKTIWAMTLILQTYRLRPLYSALGKLFTSRAFYAPSPIMIVVDGLVLVLAGAAVTLYPIWTTVFMPVAVLIYPITHRDDYRQVKKMVLAKRINWSGGFVIEEQEARDESADTSTGV